MLKFQIMNDASIEAFKQYLQMEEKAAATVYKYIHEVKAFALFLAGEPITKEKTTAYKQYLMENGYCIRSVNAAIAAVNSFFTFAGLTEYSSTDSCRRNA